MDSWSQVDKLEGNVGQALGNVILPGVIKLAAPLPLPAIGAGEKRDPAGVLDGASGDLDDSGAQGLLRGELVDMRRLALQTSQTRRLGSSLHRKLEANLITPP